MRQAEHSYVLDTTAILTFTEKEPSVDQVRGLLREGEKGKARILLSFMTFMEAYYRILKS